MARITATKSACGVLGDVSEVEVLERSEDEGSELDITLGGVMPQGGLTTIWAEPRSVGGPIQAEGIIWVSRGPVLQLEYQ